MRDSSSSKITRPLRFINSFIRNPKHTSYELARYLFWKLPPFLQSRLETPARKVVRKLRGARTSVSHAPHGLFADITNKFQVPEEFVKLYREQGHGPIDWSKSNWEDFFENLPPLQKLSVPFAMSTVIGAAAYCHYWKANPVFVKEIVTLTLGRDTAVFCAPPGKWASKK